MEGRTAITSLHPDREPKSLKGVKTTVVNQCGCYVRENIPISFKLWKKTKSTDNDADIVPETEKEMLWADIIEIDKCRVLVYDSLRKPTYYYQDLINIIQKAWARFL